MENDQNNQQPALVIHSQYIKDLSLEAPMAPEIFREMNKAPEVHVDINMENRKLDDGSYEVVLIAKMDADVNQKKLFIIELSYGCVAEVNVPAEQLEPVLFIELPRLLFPFVRSTIASNLSAAGLPPMMISPIDFVALYHAKKMQEAKQVNNQ